MFETFAAVMMLIVFLVPGYIWRTVEGQLVWLDCRLEWEKFALGLLVRSTIIYLPWSPLIYQGWMKKWYDTHPLQIGGVAVLFILILPAVIGFAIGLARQKNWFDKIINGLSKCAETAEWPDEARSVFDFKFFEQNSVPTAWDSVFTDIKPCWVIVTLKDESKGYGFLGQGSHISSDHEERDIFISHTVVKSEKGLEVVPNTGGVYIKDDEIRTVEFIKQEK
jgi:hypothetical protein